MKEAIPYIGLAQSVFAVVVIATNGRVTVSDKILMFCLGTIAIRFLGLLVSQEYPELLEADLSMGLIPLTFGPFLLLYTIYLIDGKERFHVAHLWHFAPFVLVMVVYFLFLRGAVSFNEVTYFEKDSMLWVRMLFAAIFFGSVLVYTLLTLIRLRDYQKEIQAGAKPESERKTLRWLAFITLLFSLTFLTYFITGGINALTFSRKTDMQTLTHVGLTVLAFTVSYFGLHQPASSTSGKKGSAGTAPSADGQSGGNDRSRLLFPKDQAETLAQDLIRHMESEKPYLSAELTLKELASQVGLSKYELTNLLNSHMGKNFFTFVNEYRVREVMQKLEDPGYEQPTIMAVAYECGFNSKSTFNSFFKQYTGQTPSGYRKQLGES